MITGSLPVASLLGTRRGRVVVLGGAVLTDELACVGPVAAATVRRYHAEVAVLGAAGLTAPTASPSSMTRRPRSTA